MIIKKKNDFIMSFVVSVVTICVMSSFITSAKTSNDGWKRTTFTLDEDPSSAIIEEDEILMMKNEVTDHLYRYDEIKISKNGREFIKKHESLSLTAYKLKGESRHTIGYGHVIYEDESIPHKISKKRADEIFDKDMDKFETYIKLMLLELDHRFRYTQDFVDGLASLTYNCGPDGVKRTLFWRRMTRCRYDNNTKMINQRDFEYAVAAVKSANISSSYKNGHTIRRSHEYRLMACL